MNEHRSITVPFDEVTLRLVGELAAAQGMSPESFVAQAARRVAESEADFRSFIQQGIDEADRGDLVPHDEVMAELDGMIAKHRARCG